MDLLKIIENSMKKMEVVKLTIPYLTHIEIFTSAKNQYELWQNVVLGTMYKFKITMVFKLVEIRYLSCNKALTQKKKKDKETSISELIKIFLLLRIIYSRSKLVGI